MREAIKQHGLLAIKNSPLFEIARVLVHLHHVARFIVNANHGVM
jgi:hypothetical protein